MVSRKLVFISLKSILGLQDLIDFCKDIGLQSSTAATRNVTIKLIGVLHKFVGPGNLSSICQFFVGQDFNSILVFASLQILKAL